MKLVLSFLDLDPRSRFVSELYRVPAGNVLWVEEVSLFVAVREKRPPDKAIAYLTTGQIELEGAFVNVHEPLGTIDWLDKSPRTSLGMLRTIMSTFSDQFVQAAVEMNESIALGFSGANTPMSHVTIVGCLVELPASFAARDS